MCVCVCVCVCVRASVVVLMHVHSVAAMTVRVGFGGAPWSEHKLWLPVDTSATASGDFFADVPLTIGFFEFFPIQWVQIQDSWISFTYQLYLREI